MYRGEHAPADTRSNHVCVHAPALPHMRMSEASPRTTYTEIGARRILMAPFLRLARHGRYVTAARQVLYCGFAARRALAGWLDGELSLHALCGRQMFVSYASAYGRRHLLYAYGRRHLFQREERSVSR